MHFFGRLPITQRWFSRVVIFRWVSCVLESNLSLSPLFGRLVSYRYLSSEPPPRPTLWPPVGMAIGRPHWDESAETWIVFCWTQVSLSSKPHLADFGSNLPDADVEVKLQSEELVVRQRDDYSSVLERSSSVGERRESTNVSINGCGPWFKAPSKEEREGDDMDLRGITRLSWERCLVLGELVEMGDKKMIFPFSEVNNDNGVKW